MDASWASGRFPACTGPVPCGRQHTWPQVLTGNQGRGERGPVGHDCVPGVVRSSASQPSTGWLRAQWSVMADGRSCLPRGLPAGQHMVSVWRSATNPAPCSTTSKCCWRAGGADQRAKVTVAGEGCRPANASLTCDHHAFQYVCGRLGAGPALSPRPPGQRPRQTVAARPDCRSCRPAGNGPSYGLYACQ